MWSSAKNVSAARGGKIVVTGSLLFDLQKPYIPTCRQASQALPRALLGRCVALPRFCLLFQYLRCWPSNRGLRGGSPAGTDRAGASRAGGRGLHRVRGLLQRSGLGPGGRPPHGRHPHLPETGGDAGPRRLLGGAPFRRRRTVGLPSRLGLRLICCMRRSKEMVFKGIPTETARASRPHGSWCSFLSAFVFFPPFPFPPPPSLRRPTKTTVSIMSHTHTHEARVQERVVNPCSSSLPCPLFFFF